MEKAVRQKLAIEAVEAWLVSLPGGATRLNDRELNSYTDRELICGWRLTVSFPDCPRRLDFLLNSRFPRESPLIALVDRPDFLTWPHIERDGVLCVMPPSAQVSVTSPAKAAEYLMGQACALIGDCVSGRNEDDFRAEFLSYWGWAGSKDAPSFYSLISTQPGTRVIQVWRGKYFYLLGDSKQELISWLQHRFLDNPLKDHDSEDAVLLWLDRPLIPSEFPRLASDVFSLAESRTIGGVKVLTELAAKHNGNIIVVLGCSTAHGVCFAGVILAPHGRRQAGYHGHDPVTRGFRPNKMPQQISLQRQFGENPILRTSVDRVDAGWIHGRGEDPRFSRLCNTTVAILGVGSVGGPVAMALAESGVGRFLLIDPERLIWSNVGRHPLGAPAVRAYKAKALANRMMVEYPHIKSVDAQPRSWEEVAVAAPGLLRSCDLIVSTMGDWAAEGALNEWHINEKKRPPIIYGWTEPHACAGHAVVISGNGGCFQCGFSDTGVPLLRLTNWPNGPTQKQEPACGAVYQPYGPTELSYIVALISELVLDCILQPPREAIHRVWAGRSSLLESLGGEWTRECTEMGHDHVNGGFIRELPWPSSISCTECVPG